jgi:hypothetical protein
MMVLFDYDYDDDDDKEEEEEGSSGGGDGSKGNKIVARMFIAGPEISSRCVQMCISVSLCDCGSDQDDARGSRFL